MRYISVIFLMRVFCTQDSSVWAGLYAEMLMAPSVNGVNELMTKVLAELLASKLLNSACPQGPSCTPKVHEYGSALKFPVKSVASIDIVTCDPNTSSYY